MQLPVDTTKLAEIISSTLATEYILQEDYDSADSTKYFKFHEKDDIGERVLVAVNTSTQETEPVRASLMEREFEQNIVFLNYLNATKRHDWVPVVLAHGNSSDDFPYSWVVYKDVKGWPLTAKWYQLTLKERTDVIQNIAKCVRQLALIPPSHESTKAPSSMDYIGSINQGHILFPPALATIRGPDYNKLDLDELKTHGDLIFLLGWSRAALYDALGAADNTQQSPLVADELRAITLAASLILAQPDKVVLAHANLLPHNIWIDLEGKITAIFGWEHAHYAPMWMATTPPVWLTDAKRDLVLQREKNADPWVVWQPRFDPLTNESISKDVKALRHVWDEALKQEGFTDAKGEMHDNVVRTAMRICFADEEQFPNIVQWCRALVAPSASIWFRAPFKSASVALLGAIAASCGVYSYPENFGGHPGAISAALIGVTLSLAVRFAWKHGWYVDTSVVGSCDSKAGRASLTNKMDRTSANKVVKELDGLIHIRRFPNIYGYDRDIGIEKGDVRESLAAVPCSPANSIMPTGIYVPNFLSRATTMMSRAPTRMAAE